MFTFFSGTFFHTQHNSVVRTTVRTTNDVQNSCRKLMRMRNRFLPVSAVFLSSLYGTFYATFGWLRNRHPNCLSILPNSSTKDRLSSLCLDLLRCAPVWTWRPSSVLPSLLDLQTQQNKNAGKELKVSILSSIQQKLYNSIDRQKNGHQIIITKQMPQH